VLRRHPLTARRSLAALAVIAAILLTTLGASPASAEITERGDLRLRNNGQSAFFLQPFQPSIDLFRSLDAERTNAARDLAARIEPMLRAELAGTAQLTGVDVGIGYNIGLSFAGGSGGNIAITVRVPSIEINAHARKSGVGSAVATLFVEEAVAVANYNIFTGVVDQVQILSLPIRVSASVDGSVLVDIVDLFTAGSLTNYAERLIRRGLNAEVGTAVSRLVATKVTPFSTRLFGIDSILPEIELRGVDIDQLVRDALAGAIQGRSITFSVSAGPNSNRSAINRFTIDLWGEYQLDFTRHLCCSGSGPRYPV
jgi:hypothetical protein